MSKETLKEQIDSNINTNGLQQITGEKLNNVLNDIVDEMALGGGVIEEGNTQAVSGGEVYDKTLIKDVFLDTETITFANLFNKETATIGHLGADGMTPTPSASHRMSAPIYGEPDTFYIKCTPGVLITGYTYQFDLNGNVISVDTGNLVLTLPNFSYLMTVYNITNVNINEAMFLKGVRADLPTSYIPYGSITDYSTIKNDFLDLRNDLGTDIAPATQALVTSLFEEREVLSPNLFNIATATIGHLGADGMTPTPSATHRLSEKLYLQKGIFFTKCSPGLVNSGYNYFFDENDNVLQVTVGSTFTMPLNISYCRVVFSVASVSPNSLMLLRTIPAYIPSVFYPYGQITNEYRSIKESFAPAKLYFKVGWVGDSTWWGYAARNIQLLYPGIVAGQQLYSHFALFAKNYSKNYFDAAIPGSTLAAKTEGTTLNNPMVYRISSLPNDLDLVFVGGGCNDIRQGIPLGVFTDRVATSYYGALHLICEQLIEKFITSRYNSNIKPAKIYLVTALKFLQGTGELYSETQNLWANAVKEVGAYYSIEVIDFHNESGLNPHVGRIIQGTSPEANKMYNPYMPDGIHLTPAGYDMLYDFFVSKIN